MGTNFTNSIDSIISEIIYWNEVIKNERLSTFST